MYNEEKQLFSSDLSAAFPIIFEFIALIIQFYLRAITRHLFAINWPIELQKVTHNRRFNFFLGSNFLHVKSS